MTIKMAGAGKALIAGLLPVSIALAAMLPLGTAHSQQSPPAANQPATPAPAPQTPAPATPAADPDALPAPLAEFDTNKDKAIEQKEFVAAQMKTFDEVDANKDGFVTRAEYLKQAEPPFIPADAKDLPPIEERKRILNLRFTNLDSNQDDKISREEAEQSFVREFVIMDRDQNGRVTANDIRLARAQAQAQAQAQGQDNQTPQRITKQEFMDNEMAIFARLDENKDKALDLAEFVKMAEAAPAVQREQAKQRLNTAFGEVDANKDKKISEAEWKAASERNFAQVDRNKDGAITPDEMRPPQAADTSETREQFVANRTKELMDRVDKNNDSKVSLEEFLVLASEAPAARQDQAKKTLTESFNGMDTNKNGAVERSELATHFTNLFNRIDANKDGKITQREVNAMNNPPQQQQQPRTQPAPQTRPQQPAQRPAQPAPKPQPAPQPAPQGGPPPAYPSGQAPITTTPGGQPLR